MYDEDAQQKTETTKANLKVHMIIRKKYLGIRNRGCAVIEPVSPKR